MQDRAWRDTKECLNSSYLNVSMVSIICLSLLLTLSPMSSTLLDTQNFKIDSGAWKIHDKQWMVAGKSVQIKVKINPEGDVREYVSDVASTFIGQQFFTYTAALRETEKAGVSLPEDQQAFHQAIGTMPGDNDLQKYKNYLTKTNVQLAGCYSSGLDVFDDIGVWSYYWLADWNRVNLNTTTWGVALRDEMMGYSVRIA